MINSAIALCQENAEWIVEDYQSGSGLVPFADFETVTFTDASATTVTGKKIGPRGAGPVDIKQDHKVLTSVSTSKHEVVIKYV